MKHCMKMITTIILILVLMTGCSAPRQSSYQDAQSVGNNNDSGGNADSRPYYQSTADEDMQAMEDLGDETYGAAQSMQPGDGETVSDGNPSQTKGQNKGNARTEENGETKEIKQETKEEKLVYTCDLTIETTSYKETLQEIEKQIKEYSGIIESQNEYDNDSGWYIDGHKKTSGTMECTITVRIPSKSYQAFLKSLEGKGKMTHKSMDVTNISRTYYDTQATIQSLEIQEKRLLKMMEDAKDIDDMIKVESRLTEVQTQLNQYKTQLSVMDTQVAYSTVTMTIEEVLEYKPTTPGKKTNTFAERFVNTLKDSRDGFLSFMEGLLFLLIRLLPFIIVFAVVWFATKPLRRRFTAYRRLKKEQKRNDSSVRMKNERKRETGRFKIDREKTERTVEEDSETVFSPPADLEDSAEKQGKEEEAETP